ncbi:hypothetical protein SDC9_123763 [bioreactor metagenome]|uniref:Uncharacterized protein n=1 Tax=bioreactor metagenome TaxID=1076179 RepID=A0A645CIL2_9ZZZZ|nr:hypothetical protein [Christensenella sp.]
MISVLGYPLHQAKALLEQKGVVVSAEEVRSKKGVECGIDARVIRQDILDESRVHLLYAIFRTEPD